MEKIKDWERKLRDLAKKDRDLIRKNTMHTPYTSKYVDEMIQLVDSAMEMAMRVAFAEGIDRAKSEIEKAKREVVEEILKMTKVESCGLVVYSMEIEDKYLTPEGDKNDA